MDKRFAELLHYIDKRFEATDKRLEELLHYINKRFEDINKRFEDINKRFEEINHNFSFFKWFLSIFITVLFSLSSLFFYFIQEQNQRIYRDLLTTLNELKVPLKK